MSGGGTQVQSAIWGKSRGLPAPYPLLAHMVDTAAVTVALVDGHLPPSTRDRLGADEPGAVHALALAAGLHDLGKATPAFQGSEPQASASLREQGFTFPAGPRLRHDHATRLTLPEALAACGLIADGELGSWLHGPLGLACMLGGHHGVFQHNDARESSSQGRRRLLLSEPTLGDQRWAEQRAALVAVLRTALRAEGLPRLEGADQLVVAAGLVVIADWIASDKENFIGAPETWPTWEEVEWGQWLETRICRAHESIRAAGLSSPKFKAFSFEEAFGFGPRPVQESVGNHLAHYEGSPGIVVVTAPMGIGKTEVALAAARAMGGAHCGLVFALPTMATTDAMFDRLVAYASRVCHGEVSVDLAHSMASFNEAFTGLADAGVDPVSDDETVVVARKWLQGRQRALLAPIAAATVDQVLAAGLRARRGFLRWFGLMGKTVVIDEAHSLDAYMHGLMSLTLTWLGKLHVPVVVLSATLPSRVSSELIGAWCAGAGIEPPADPVPYPGWMHVDGSSGAVHREQVEVAMRTVSVTARAIKDWPTSWCDEVRIALEPLAEGGCGLVVCNTVADAQRLALELQLWAEEHGAELDCLHARFPNGQRRSRTAQIVARFGKSAEGRPARSVLVATQVIEQSLDVDFDRVVSCLAPIAQLLQRAGRGHRHDRPRPPLLTDANLTVLAPVDTDGELEIPQSWMYVYPRVYLERTWRRSLDGGRVEVVSIPGDVQRLVDDVYGSDLAETEVEPALADQLDREHRDQFANPTSRIPLPDAVASLADLSAKWDEELVIATRLGTPSVSIVCAYDQGGRLTLDPEGTFPLPETATRADTRAVLDHAVPMRRTRATLAIVDATERPPAWADNPWLAGLGVLALDPDAATAEVAGHRYHLHPLVGLVRERLA